MRLKHFKRFILCINIILGAFFILFIFIYAFLSPLTPFVFLYFYNFTFVFLWFYV